MDFELDIFGDEEPVVDVLKDIEFGDDEKKKGNDEEYNLDYVESYVPEKVEPKRLKKEKPKEEKKKGTEGGANGSVEWEGGFSYKFGDVDVRFEVEGYVGIFYFHSFALW